MDSLGRTLNNVRGRHNASGGRGKDTAPMPEVQHLEAQPMDVQNNTLRSAGQHPTNKANDTILQQQITGQRKALPTGRPTPAAQYNNKTSLNSDSSSPEKPAFTRGVSVIDQTAVTSTAPTPAGEIQNPMSFGMGQSIARQRESHLPDEDLREQIRTMSKGEHADGREGYDEFGDDLSRQETEKGR